MTTLVKNKVQVQANIFNQSKNLVVNSVMEMALEIAHKRNLDPFYLLSRRKIIEEGMYVWLHEKMLQEIMLEVSLSGSGSALERYDFIFEYHDTPDLDVHQAPTPELGRFCETLKSLPPGSSYRILARVAPGAKEVPGWRPTTLKDLKPTTEQRLGDVGYGHIAGQVFYRGGTW